MAGGFEYKLWEAISHADDSNLQKLHAGFPSEVSAYISWTRGDLGQRMRTYGVDI